MADFAASAAANTAGNLATEYASPYVSYFFRYGKIVENFRNGRNQLLFKRDQVKNDVDEAVSQTEIIEKDVQDWLMRAEKELGEAQNLEDEIERSSKCFKWCPNWGWRYCLSKKVAKKTLSISELLQIPDFRRVGRRPRLEGIEFHLSNDHFLPSESSKAAFSGIIKALSSDGVTMVGLYGMPGVGKTTLAEQVGKHARKQKLFDKVVIFAVSQTPNINKIQDEIAEVLGLKFQATTEKRRAEELLLRLKDEQKILIIIDDVWGRLELKHIGIPLGDGHKGCKILLTTRRLQVCTQMKCQEKFQLDILSESEAWALFKKEDNAGLENASSSLIDVAQKVARECKGLPLAIVTMGRALKDETLDGWKVVYQRLKESRHSDNEDVCIDIYSSLQISYDYLEGNINIRSSRKEKGINKSQQCLLLCSLFPEDYEFGLDELTTYGVGQGMFDNVSSIEDARREMRSLITNLQKSGLLLETSDEGIAKMHDVVRDFVHWMTSEGENMLLVKSGSKEWPRSESLGCCTAVSLINSEINNFPDSLEFPKLKTFRLDRVMRGVKIDVPSTFLQGMKVLKVLVLQNVSLSSEGLQFLPNLRTLRLKHCELKNVSSLGNLKKLEILVISYSRLIREHYTELFCGLTGLTTLRLLDISHYSNEVWTLPKNFLSSLVQLEGLHLLLCIKWATIGEEGANIAGLSELLLSCSRLTQLSLRVSSECIPKGFVFHPLQRFNIAVIVPEDYFSWYNRQHRTSRRLTIRKKFSSNTFKELFCNVEDLTLGDVMHLEYLIDATKEQLPESAFSNLVRLTLDNMNCLKELCHELPSIVFLHKLEYLTIKRCTNLVFELATCLPNLKELELEQCGQVQVIFQTDRDRVLLQANEEIRTPLLSSLGRLRLVSLPELKSIWKGPTDHVSLQGLKYATVSRCNKLKFVFSLSIAQTLEHLQGLDVSDCDGVEQVFYCEEQTDDGKDITLPQLHTLKLKGLRSLRNFYSENYFVKLPSLKTLAVSNCGEFTHVKDELGVSATKDELETLDVDVHIFKEIFCNPKYLTLHGKTSQKSLAGDAFQGRLNEVTELQLESCNDLECLIEQTQELNDDDHSPKRLLPKLKELTVKNCKDMVSLLPATINLEEVDAESCVQLQVIFQMEGSIPTGEENQEMLLLSNLKGLKLELLPELKCIWKGPTHHVNLQSLKFMAIIRCDKLTSLFSPSLAQTLLHLEDLQIQSCKELEHIISSEPGRDDHGTVSWNILLPQLREFELKDLENLSSLCPRNYLLMSPSLENFNVSNCPKLTHDTWWDHVYGEKGSRLYAFKEMICCSKNLTLNRSNGCRNLILDVDPKGLNELTSIQLHNVGNIECLYNTTEHRQPTVAFSNLVELVMEEMSDLRKLCNNQPPKGFLPKLEKLEITKCMKLASLSPLGQNLKEVMIEDCCQLREIFEVDEILHNSEANQAPLMSNLRTLDLELLSELRCIWKGPSQSVINLGSLKIVNISNCKRLTCLFSPSLVKSLVHLEQLFLHDLPELEQLITEQESDVEQEQQLLNMAKGPSHSVINLQNLKIIKISNCKRLRRLFSVSLVKSLVVLEQLNLHDLPELVQVITDLGSDAEQEQQVFNVVKAKVDGQHKYINPFRPSWEFKVSKCPQLRPIVIQEEVNDQAQVKGLYLSNRQYSSFDILLRQSLPYLEHITVGNHLQFLRWLIISNCNELKSLSPRMLAQSLPHLSYLHVERCEELEQIIDKDETSASSSQGHLQPICFPSLMEICIEECNNLKSSLSVSVVLSLSQLKCFTIRGASKLEQIFEYEGGIDIEDTEILPQLVVLSLEELPRLQSFIPMGYHCSFPQLTSLKVKECPRLTTIFRVDSERTIHAMTETVGNSPMKDPNTDIDVMEGSATDLDLTSSETTWPVGSDINWNKYSSR